MTARNALGTIEDFDGNSILAHFEQVNDNGYYSDTLINYGLTFAHTGSTLDFEFRTLMILAGTTNDVMYRLIDNDTAPTTELRSDCMMITAR